MELANAVANIICHVAVSFEDFYAQVQSWLLQRRLVPDVDAVEQIRFVVPLNFQVPRLPRLLLSYGQVMICLPIVLEITIQRCVLDCIVDHSWARSGKSRLRM